MSSPSQPRADNDDKLDGKFPKESIGLPIKSIEWMTLHCNSNVELAILSNVCTSWRDIVCQTLEQVFVTSLEKDGKKNDKKEVSKLLLPCMALELLRRGSLHQNEERTTVKRTLEENGETFCLAWFAPVGLQFQSLCIDEEDESDDYCSSSSTSYDDCDPDMSFEPSAAIEESSYDKHGGQNRDTTITNLYALNDSQRKRHSKEDYTKERFAPGGVDFYEGSDDENKNKRQKDKKQPKKRNSATAKTDLPSSSSAVPTVHFKDMQTILTPTSEHGDGNGSVASDAYKSARLQTCIYEWRGYRHATDILIPLGYSTVFIRRVLDLAVNLVQSPNPTSYPTTEEDQTLPNNNKAPLQTVSSSSSHKHRWGGTSSEYTRTTFAVRGATLARPDNYCLCLDSLDNAEYDDGDNRPKREDNEKTYTGTVAAADKHRRYLYRLKHTRQKQRLKRKKRKEMARLFLPRMIRSAKVKNPFIQFDTPSNDTRTDNDKVAVSSVEGKRSRCIQFLNVNGTHAVFLRTLPFECGKIKGPITLFLIGVATEDGCFVSGLKSRYEVGHLYPTDPRDMLINMSPICIATDNSICEDDKVSNNEAEMDDKASDTVCREGMEDLWEGVIGDINDSTPDFQTTIANPNMPATAAGFLVPSSSPMRNDFSSSYDSDSDSSDDSSDGSEDTGYKIHCTCPFQSHNNRNSAIHFSKHHHNGNITRNMSNHNRSGGRSSIGGTYNDEEEQEEEEPPPAEEENIYRGRMGPGLWHCYTIIFDGEESVIRVDGLLEPLQKGWLQEQDDDNDEKDMDKEINSVTHPSSSSHTVASTRQPTTLDGLTIGSDHVFDMSLCYGDASDGEGEGAIAELAVFKGRMDTSDMECMERYLMEKHGIPPPLSANTTLDDDKATQSKFSNRHPNPSSPWQEDEWSKQANALIVQPPPWKISDQAVPLRVAAKHKSVAWHRTNNVTGKVITVSRIGSKYSTGSSDW